jgi:anti-anti-sigma factor
MFNYKINKKENALEIIVEGKFDTEGAKKLQDDLENHIENDISSIKFDLSKTTMIASSGLRVFYFAKDYKEDMQVDIVGAHGLVMKIIKTSGITHFINVVE